MNSVDIDGLVILYSGPGMDRPEILAGPRVTVVEIDDRTAGQTTITRPDTRLPDDDMLLLLSEARTGDVSIATLLAVLHAKATAAGVELQITMGDANA